MHDYAAVFSHLQDDLPKTDVILTSDMSLSEARALWLRKSFLKKFEGLKTVDADAKAFDLFLKMNQRCKHFSLKPERLFQEELIGEVKNLFDEFLHRGPDLALDLFGIAEGFGVGPGASQGAISDNFYTKLFDSNLTHTSGRLYREYRCAIAPWPVWTHAEIARSTHHRTSLVEGNRLSFVPKTSEISRTICTEPNLNMLFQKGIGAFLEHQLLRRWKISMSYQQGWNRWLARRGSEDGSFGTIDLSSASDSVSLNLLREILPPYFLRWLELTRSPVVILPDGSREELHMVSSMGNAFTFPLQTMLFASVVVSSYRILGIKPMACSSESSNFGIFGDDIIVRKDSYDFVVRALEMFGFLVNDDKSFNTGHFRESCGGDYFRGHDIRGVYLKNLDSSADVYSIINRLVRWSADSGIMLYRVIRHLLGLVEFLPIPADAGDAEGIKVPYPPSSLARSPDTGGVIYRYLSSRPMSFALPEGEDEACYYPFNGKKRTRVLFNPDGLLTSVVGGFVRNGRVAVRTDRARFKIRRRVTSSWGGKDAVGSLNSRGGRWKAAAELLLGNW
jgi:hypothetical protein